MLDGLLHALDGLARSLTPLTKVLLATAASGSAYPIGCLPSSMRDARLSRLARSNSLGRDRMAKVGRSALPSLQSWSCCFRREASWPSPAQWHSRSAQPAAFFARQL